ncbi:MAG: flagellar biosynthesis protein FlaG [Betaproteobacteria bacterium HGW-Betaproteobacteria-22]|nr:MAG: flagellar biosynthesis protein FlaG [Betaproteobacteria bacterium HGW-Betaproteobacteria-22]
MFNSSLEAYGGIKVTTPVQKVADSRANVQNISNARANLPAENASNRPATEVNKEALTNAVGKLNELVAPALQTVQFSMDDEAGRMVVKVIDTATQKTIRQIPNEEVLAFSKTLGRLQGLVVRERA